MVKKSVGVQTQFEEMKGWLLELERGVAGFSKIQGALAALNGEKTGDRVQGMPILTMPATADGKTPLQVVYDMKFLDPAHIPNVLIPLLHMSAAGITDALGEVEDRILALRAYFNAILNRPQKKPPDGPTPGGGEEETEDGQ